MALHILKINDVVPLSDGRFRVVRINGSRVALVPESKKLVTMTDRKGNEHVFAAEGRIINISPSYEGPVYRDGRRITVITRERFRRIKAAQEA